MVSVSYSGPVVQSVRMPACHAGGREFESRPVRHHYVYLHTKLSLFGPVVQSVRMPACHAGGREFESRPVRHDNLISSYIDKR